jgi:tRNA-dihydrouridine synthase
MNVDGFCSNGREAVTHRLKFEESEQPLIVQLWGLNPLNFRKTIKYVKTLKPSGIDINMGCSVRNVLSHGAGSGLIQTPTLAKEIIDTVKDSAGNIPVSVKTRLGYDSVITEEWISFLLEQKIDALTVHGRIAKEGYNSPSNWNEMSKIVQLRDEISPDTIIIGNGDIKSLQQGIELIKKYNLDGFMVGRGIMSNPWLFANNVNEISVKQRFQALYDHISLFETTWEGKKPLYSQRKYIKMYLNDFEGVNDIRKELMMCNELDEMKNLILKQIS